MVSSNLISQWQGHHETAMSRGNCSEAPMPPLVLRSRAALHLNFSMNRCRIRQGSFRTAGY